MRLIYIVFLFMLFSSVSGRGQSSPVDSSESIRPSKYLLKAKGPNGEVISTTGRIVKAIALSRPQSLEIAHVYVNYTVSIKLNTDINGETVAVVSFNDMKLSGDLVYKGFDIEKQIFPSLVSFQLIPKGKAKGSTTAKVVMATVKSANINSGDCSVSVSFHKTVTEIPILDKLVFFHSEEDFEKADNQMKLIDSYIAAGWLMQRTGKLLDDMQFPQLHDPAAFLASNLEVIVLMDWITRQHFNRYPVFQQNDSLSLGKRLVVEQFRKKLIDHDFIQKNVIRYVDLEKAANLFAENIANYFDTNQPDFNRAAYLSQMAGSRLSTIGYKYIREFADSYAAVHKSCKIDWRMFVPASALIRHAMTMQASKLAEEEQYTEAMGLLNASENYELQIGDNRLQTDSLLISQLSQRLYAAYIDIALKSLGVGVYRVTFDYYQKAYLLRKTFGGMIPSDTRERYLADMICKDMLIQAEKSFKSSDIVTALATYDEIIRLADNARLKNAYETAKSRLETISNRPSGYKPWDGEDLAVIVPVKEKVALKELTSTASRKKKMPVRDALTAVVPLVKNEDSTEVVTKEVKVNSKRDSLLISKVKKPVLTKSHIKDIKDSVFLVRVIKRLQANAVKKARKDSIALANIDKRIILDQSNTKGQDSAVYLDGFKKQFLLNRAHQIIKDSTLLAANVLHLQSVQSKLALQAKSVPLVKLEKKSIIEKGSIQKSDSIAVLDTTKQMVVLPKKKIQTKNLKPKKIIVQADSVKVDVIQKEPSFNFPEIKQQIGANIKSIHLKIWSGDTLSSLKMLNQTDSLQLLLSRSGDKSFEVDMKALRMNYDEMCCAQQKTSYLRELDQIRSMLKTKDFALASAQLKKLISKHYTSTCNIDKTEATRLLTTLESPVVFKKWQLQLDSITKSEEPAAIIEAYEKANEYYRINMLDKLGLEAPDMMVALKSRNETSFLLKAVLEMLNSHRPTYALELMKEIRMLEPKPDKTVSLQKRLGEMLASGDHVETKTANEVLDSYNINDKWYDELVSAFKKQWKLFAK